MQSDFDPAAAIRRLVEMAEGLGDGYTGCCDPATDETVMEAGELYSALVRLPLQALYGSSVTDGEIAAAGTAYSSITGKPSELGRRRGSRGPMTREDAVRFVLEEADRIGYGIISGAPYSPDREAADAAARSLEGAGRELPPLLPEGMRVGAFVGAYRLVTGRDL